jgi:hypothetical protein
MKTNSSDEFELSKMEPLGSPLPPANSIGALQILKGLGAGAGWLVLMFGVALLALLITRGGAWLSDKLYPWLVGLSAIAFAFSVLELLPLAIFRETRGYSGAGFYLVSFVFGVTLWVWSFLTTYVLWGGFALAIGLFMAGVGVLPIALLATAFKGHWWSFCQLLLVAIATFTTRGFGLYLVERAEQYRFEHPDQDEGKPFPQRLVTATWLLLAGSFFPYLYYLTFVPFVVCAIILCFSRSCRARRHGRALLFTVAFTFVVLIGLGMVFYKSLPSNL